MNYIIDTHIFLWFLQDSDNLSHQSKTTIANIENNIFISIASFWEIAIKLSLEKLVLDISLMKLFEEAKKLNMQILDIKKEHLVILEKLPFIHKDPFDRLIIAQSINENLCLISDDKIFSKYELNLL